MGSCLPSAPMAVENFLSTCVWAVGNSVNVTVQEQGIKLDMVHNRRGPSPNIRPVGTTLNACPNLRTEMDDQKVKLGSLEFSTSLDLDYCYIDDCYN